MAAPTQKILHVAGWNNCGFFARTLSVLRSVAVLFPSRVKIVEHAFDDRASYRDWLIEKDNFRAGFANDVKAQAHSSSPFCWFGKTESQSDIDYYLGGHDDTMNWCREFFAQGKKADATPAATMVADGHTTDHGYEYDLIVIGGGSGGMAAAKEAAALGAKVALLDFVKPSPKGTTWGLGGTCVNVGCIPKRLFHDAALLRESLQADTPAFGIHVGGGKNEEEIKAPETTVQWEALRQHINDYIRSLNFKYRVRLREKEVTYFNKLAKFVDAHTIEATDKKGRTSTMTASRFLVATGGRPAPIDCEGGDLAISSDDIFMLESSPGKTLCVGASYISLECAGFLAALGLDTTVAVRSILLRGFDRECADKIGHYMEAHGGVKFKKQVTPSKLEKQDDGKILVSFSDGTQDTFDTVLGAIGRLADTDKLGLDTLGVTLNAKNKKIIGKLEQSSLPNVYAVGDVLDKTPELTPVAIQAGITLARRLFGGSTEPMDYQNVCTAVFTPIEYACVGLSEDDAIETYGKDDVEVYHSEFQPLEWSLSLPRAASTAFCKAIVIKSMANKVVGLHYVGPKAGEVMQGYGVAMKQGLDYKTLVETVGIHPTSSEELVTLTITKGSGEDAAAGGC